MYHTSHHFVACLACLPHKDTKKKKKRIQIYSEFFSEIVLEKLEVCLCPFLQTKIIKLEKVQVKSHRDN